MEDVKVVIIVLSNPTDIERRTASRHTWMTSQNDFPQVKVNLKVTLHCRCFYGSVYLGVQI
jgi:hypothetical protein